MAILLPGPPPPDESFRRNGLLSLPMPVATGGLGEGFPSIHPAVPLLKSSTWKRVTAEAVPVKRIMSVMQRATAWIFMFLI